MKSYTILSISKLKHYHFWWNVISIQLKYECIQSFTICILFWIKKNIEKNSKHFSNQSMKPLNYFSINIQWKYSCQWPLRSYIERCEINCVIVYVILTQSYFFTLNYNLVTFSDRIPHFSNLDLRRHCHLYIYWHEKNNVINGN